jgi:SAM-dependent methyltransferase
MCSFDVSMPPDDRNRLLAKVADYYSGSLRLHGATPRGVDWNGSESQTLRFEQLAKIVPDGAFSLTDLGCGYGAFLDFLKTRRANVEYVGIDVSVEMIAAARQRHPTTNARFIVGGTPDGHSDVSVASGIFNVRVGESDEAWWRYIVDTLDLMNQCSTFGFAFNCLTSFSQMDKRRDHLYYADPAILLTHCLGRYSRNVTLLHGYGLYEFTVLVRKD